MTPTQVSLLLDVITHLLHALDVASRTACSAVTDEIKAAKKDLAALHAELDTIGARAAGGQ